MNVVRRWGYVTVTAPRAGHAWLVLSSVAGSLGLAAASFLEHFPYWGLPIAAVALVLVVWRLLPPATLKFDTRKGVVLKDGEPIAQLAEIECVQLTERGLGEEAFYVVELRLADGRLIFLGDTKEEIDASSAAALVSGAVGRPVQVAAG